MRKLFYLLFPILVLLGCKKEETEPTTTSSGNETDTTSLGKWTQKSSFKGESRYGSFGFSLEDKLYVGGGHHQYYFGSNKPEYLLKDFWEYDPSTDSWAQKNNLPFLNVVYVASFTINGKGYITTGISDESDTSGDIYSNELWEFDPSLDEWTKKASFPGQRRTEAISFSDGTKGYVGLGHRWDKKTFKMESFNDLWEYNVLSDKWTKMQDFPATTGTRWAVAFSTTKFGYSITADRVSPNECWRYSFSTNEWKKMKDFAGSPNTGGTGFVLNDQVYYKPLYLASNQPLSGYTGDFWLYDDKANDWTKKASDPSFSLPDRLGIAVQNKGYLLLGHNNSSRLRVSNEVWEYSLD